ncbi:hypothetical protein [Gloeobacter kilaueensis]|uniref:Uncharacterized protein n=1 Tax=Gloeobacter kilaueensis (strain ATCC BAA-2537 / CCAP 1431/1 / ULC 316 / JS1) TaxID=1183438 RepID=U5QJ01_GLOK1|nr:hypothetical protein [Gloeobacter kilaueensis]AGY58886.1 hypothetical protein GKIL_2640 [Gloeobacter kilaueensis JS1]
MKPEKIDLQLEYPCPRCKRGRLQAIVLTEAFGCDRCSQIFGLSTDGLVLEQLSTSYPYKKAWQWTGGGWRDQNRSLADNYFPFLLVALALIPPVWLPLLLQPRPGLGMLALLTAVLSLSLVVFWLARRNRF